MRVFIAFTPNKNIRNNLYEFAKRFDSVCKSKKVEQENIHLTFFFWSNLEENEIEKIILSLNFLKFNPFTVTLDNLNIFYRRKFPSVMNIKVKSKNILELKTNLDMILEKHDIDFEKRKFLPHLTLMRIKHIDSINKFMERFEFENNNFEKISFNLDSITLYQSILKKKGPEYNVLHHKKLK
jgi:2'-5' RNA ligase